MELILILFYAFLITTETFLIKVHCDYQPESSISSNVYRFDPIFLIEEPPIGTLIFDLASKLDINDLANSNFKFKFYAPNSITAHFFLIDQLTGQLKTQRRLDREYLCETKVCGPCNGANNCSLSIEIVAISKNSVLNTVSNQQQKFVSFDVIIQDKNEFAPQFPQSLLILNLSEGAPQNFNIPLDPAIDRDSGQNQIIYTILPILNTNKKIFLNETEPLDENNYSVYLDLDNEEYQKELKELNTRIKLVTSFLSNKVQSTSFNDQKLNLIIVEPFDYEIEKELTFRIVASDGEISKNGHNNKNDKIRQKVLFGSCLITIKIIDINDNLPIFDQQEYEYRLDEDKALSGTRLIRVHATDKDDGLNGLIKYFLMDQAISSMNNIGISNHQKSQNIKNLFEIDENTGWISVTANSNLDYEQMPIYHLSVKAQDCGLSNSMPVYTRVVIYLNDVNDNIPKINITFPSLIDDLNNNLSMDNNIIELSEWTVQDTFVAQVIVTDIDSGLNGKVKIKLNQFKRKTRRFDQNGKFFNNNDWEDSNDFNLVHLFNNIYSLMTTQPLDRESFDRYSINITASDCGLPIPLKSHFAFQIKIKDENDNKPIFLDIPEVMKINEFSNTPYFEFKLVELPNKNSNNLNENWITIGHIKTIDYDLDENSLIKYDIQLLNSSCNTSLKAIERVKKDFKIEPYTGVLKALNHVFDRELCERYEFTLNVIDNPNSDKNNNKLTTKLLIEIIDINDNEPIFEKSVYKFELSENKFSKNSFGQVIALDNDKPNTKFSLVKYTIYNENDEINILFKINDTTGELYQIKELDYEAVHFYEFKIIAYDNLNLTGSLYSICLVRIDIIDMNDNYPIFISPSDSSQPLIFSIESLNKNQNSDSEYQYSLTNLFSINATDADSYLNNKLEFKIEKQIKLIKKYLNDYSNDEISNSETVNLFDCDTHTGLISIKLNTMDIKNSKKDKTDKNVISSYSNIKTGTLFSSVNDKKRNIKALVLHNDGQNSFHNLLNIEGIYGLVIKINDLPSNKLINNQLSNRVYIFIALTRNSIDLKNQTYPETKNQNIMKDNIILLKDLISEIKLNNSSYKYVQDLYQYEYDDYVLINDNNFKFFNGLTDQDFKFNKLINLYTHSSSKMINKNSNIKHMSSYLNKIKKLSFEKNVLVELKNKIIEAFTGKNYKYFLIILISTGFIICFVIISLSMSVYYYKQRTKNQNIIDFNIENYDKDKSYNRLNYSINEESKGKNYGEYVRVDKNEIKSEYGSKKNSNDVSTSLLTKTTNSTNYNQNKMSKNDNSTNNSLNSISSSEQNKNTYCRIITDINTLDKHSNRYIYRDDEPHYSSLFKKNKNSNLAPKCQINYFKMNDGLGREESTEEKTILIVDTNSPNSDLSSSYVVSNSISNNTSITTNSSLNYNKTPLNKKNDDFMVLITSPSLGSHKKKNVASVESLTSISTSNSSSSEKNYKLEQQSQLASNFKTFKSSKLTNSFIQCSTPNHKFGNSNNSEETSDQQGKTDLYKTMPSKYIKQSSQKTSKTHLINNCDQKQLNLPVNELYKRYRIHVGSSSSLSSIQSSINSVQFNLNQNKNQQLKLELDKDEKKESKRAFISTFTPPRLILKSNNSKLLFEHNSEMPDYFFKNEKELKKFSFSNDKKILNLKHIVKNEIEEK